MSNILWMKPSAAPAPVRSDSHEWVFQWAQQALALEAMQNGARAPLRVGAAGPVVHADVYTDFVKLLETQGAKRVEESFYVWDDDFEEAYAWKDGAAFLTSADESCQFGANIVTTNYEFAEEVREFLHNNLLKSAKTNQGRVYILTATPEGIKPTPLGFAAVPLDVENYDPTIQQSLVKAVSDLQTPFPDGRLTILEGPPGCGKTFLIRSLVHEIPTAKFVFVPPAMVPNLGDPSLVSALLALHEKGGYDDDEAYSGPTVLICEDADSILTARAADNMPAISSVLNLTSGLLGDVIDIRVVATTNAVKSDIEPALLRSGRLAQYIQVPPVKKDHATRILQKLLNDESVRVDWPAAKVPRPVKRERTIGFSSDETETLRDQVLLADIFKIAKGRGWKPVKVKAKVESTKLAARRPRPYAISHSTKGVVKTISVAKSKKASAKTLKEIATVPTAARAKQGSVSAKGSRRAARA